MKKILIFCLLLIIFVVYLLNREWKIVWSLIYSKVKIKSQQQHLMSLWFHKVYFLLFPFEDMKLQTVLLVKEPGNLELLPPSFSLFTDPSMKALKVDAPQTFPTEGSSAYSRDRSSCYSRQESSWLTQAGMPPGFLQTPFQSQSPSPFPPHSSPYPHPLLLQHLTFPSDHRQLWVRSEAVGRPSERYSHPCSDGIAVGSAGQLHTHDPPASSASRIVERETETSAADSKRVRGGGGGRCLSSELDIKPGEKQEETNSVCK